MSFVGDSWDLSDSRNVGGWMMQRMETWLRRYVLLSVFQGSRGLTLRPHFVWENSKGGMGRSFTWRLCTLVWFPFLHLSFLLYVYGRPYVYYISLIEIQILLNLM